MHTRTGMCKHSANKLQPKTTRNTPVVEQVQLLTCCREGEYTPWEIMGLSKPVLEGSFSCVTRGRA